MKYTKIFLILCFLSSTLILSGQEESRLIPPMSVDQMVEALKPRTYCAFVPQREDDFAFENNYIAMRFYGPALRDKPEGAGCDCWTKRVEYPIIEKWYKLTFAGHSYHIDRGEGWDGYKVGNSAGTGGTALWINDDRAELDCFTEWEILENTPERCSFILTYEAEIGGSAYKEEKHITLEMNMRLYTAVSTFWKDGEIAKGLPVCIGVATHDGIATCDARSGWISSWETLKDKSGLGTAAAMPPDQIKSIEFQTGKSETGKTTNGHILMIAETDDDGKIKYAAGYGWELAGTIISQDSWTDYLTKFCKSEYK